MSPLSDNNVYYQNGIYQTPAMIPIFTRNRLKMNNKGFGVCKKIGGFRNAIPLSDPTGIAGEHQIPFLAFLSRYKLL